MSTIEDIAGTALAARIREHRETRAWSLAELADRAGVSKAMLSKVERAEASPTAATLSRIATAYGLTMAALFERTQEAHTRLLRAKDQPLWRDPKTAYRRRQVFLSASHPLELVEVELPSRQEVGFPASAYHLLRHVVWVLSNRLTILEGDQRHDLDAGDRLEFGPRRISSFATSMRGLAAMSSRRCGNDPQMQAVSKK